MRFITALIVGALFSCSLFAGGDELPNIPGKTISLSQLEDMFTNMTENYDWDVSEEMLWGYFFTNDEPTKLEAAKKVLVSRGYRFVDIYLSDKDEPTDPDMFWLHVEKEETHTPMSLDARNDELYLFAHEFNLQAYDGMDVGPIDNQGN